MMSRLSRRCPASAACFACLALVGPALASQPPTPGEPALDPALDPQPHATGAHPDLRFSILGGGEHQFRTSIDGGGRIEVSRFTAGLTAQVPITEELRFAFLANYGFDMYNFRGETALGGFDPWEDIHTLSFGAIFTLDIDEAWSVFAGPVFQFARESGASWDDGFIGGGVVGAEYAFSDDLSVGAGFGVVTQIEDSARVFPVLILDWRLDEHLRITSHTAATAAGDIGFEIVYQLDRAWEVAGGLAYRFRRFRLDDGGPAPDGVGQERSLPVWARLSWHLSPHISANLYGGGVFGGDLRLEDSGGGLIASEDYDPAAMVGLSVNVRF